jgi:hypothetical protein
VSRVLENKEWFVEEHLLTLPILSAVFNEGFIVITSAPLETHKTTKNVFHDTLLYMPEIYMSRLFVRKVVNLSLKKGLREIPCVPGLAPFTGESPCWGDYLENEGGVPNFSLLDVCLEIHIIADIRKVKESFLLRK